MDRLYMVSMFRDKQAANRRQTWLNSTTLRNALCKQNAAAQRQVILCVANSFRKPPDTIAWSSLKFTLLPLHDDGHYLDTL